MRPLGVRSVLLAVVVCAAGAVCGAATDEQAKLRARAESDVTADLARRKQSAPEAIRVVESVERTWPDERLGCVGRQLVGDPLPVKGFRIVLALDDRRYVYHADRDGHFVPCDRPGKPIGPIR